MGIPDLVRRIRDEEPEPPAELVNGPHTLCECNDEGCGAPFIEPRHLRGA